MATAPRAFTDQIQEILAKYRNLDVKDKGATDAFAKQIAESTIPSYHKEVLVVGLLTARDGETTLSLHMLRQQEQLKHLEALLNIERRVLEERIAKHQSR